MSDVMNMVARAVSVDAAVGMMMFENHLFNNEVAVEAMVAMRSMVTFEHEMRSFRRFFS